MERKTMFGVVGALVCGVVFSIASPLSAYALPAGFVNQLLANGLSQPTDFAFAPDGRIFITQKMGQVTVYKNGVVLPTPALSISAISTGISTGGDRGLLSLALDPQFSTNNFVYLLYTTGGNHERISRFTMTGDTIDPASELILLENPAVWSGFLNAGTIRYNPVDGKLYVTLGSNGLGANSQDLSSLDGKLLRLNLDGTIPADNPFTGVQGAQPSIWSYGLRNPWKMNIDANGTAIIGDVGENTWEKIVRSAKGANFGWPKFEGSCLPNCAGVTPPLWVYNHNGAGASVTGGDTYRGTAFPAQYRGNYFFGDYVLDSIFALTIDAQGNATASNTFDTGVGTVAGINAAPDGCLYYIVIFPGSFHRICFGTPLPILHAFASSNVNSGAFPLAVQFSSAGSNDSSGAALNYSWDFGDGGTGSGANPSHTYTGKGVYTATLTVSDGNGTSSANTKIWAGYFPPNPVITAPVNGAKYNDGDTINFAGSATDPQDGALPAAKLSWTITYHHNTHIHPPINVPGAATGTFIIPNTDAPEASYEYDLTATDEVGLSSTTVVSIRPNIAAVQYESNPAGAQLLLDDQPATTPYTDATVVGYRRQISVNSPQTIATSSYAFASWSNGGAQSKTMITPPATTTVTANFTLAGSGTAASITSSAKTDAPAYNPGQSLFITAPVIDTGNLDNALIDLELWRAGIKVAQTTVPENFTAGQTINASWNTVAPTSTGIYTIKLGVFSSDWATLYHWNDLAGTFSVGSGGGTASSTLSFVSSAATDAANYVAGAAAKITSTVTATQNVSNLVLDTEIWGVGGKVSQNTVPLSLLAGTPSSFSWNTTAPAAPGAYTVKLGVFSSDWTKLYDWNASAGTFTVSPAPPAFAIVDHVTTDAASYAAGSPVTLTAAITPNQTIASSTILDLELADASNALVLQHVSPVTLTANRTATTTWNFTAPANGTYAVKLGVASSDWSKIYFWDNAAGTLQVGAPPALPAFSVSASMPGSTFSPGQASSITTKVTATGNLANVVIDTEVIDPNGALVLQNSVPTSLVANQQFVSAWNVTLPSSPLGQYVIKVGIFPANWSSVYYWGNRAFTFFLGTPPGSPVPGTTYPITVSQPADGATVSGTQEVRATIGDLDINSYNIGWRTGDTDPYFTMDTDPITQNFKHVWIDFVPWTWNPNNIYPLSFQATDLSNNIIGSSTIHVTVQH